jgi:hypothetical protein
MKSVEMLGNSFTTLFKSFKTLNVTIWQPFHSAISNFSKIIPDADFVFPSWGISVSVRVGRYPYKLAI